MSSKRQNSSPQEDLSQVRQPIQISGKPVEQVLNSVHYGSPELRCLLMDECDLIFECKVCRALFRDLPNFISHKRSYCTESCLESMHMAICRLPEEKVVVVQPQAPEETEAQEGDASLRDAGLVRRTRPSRPSLEETVQRIQSGELGRSEAYRVYTEAAEKLQRQKESMKVATVRTTAIPTNKNAVFIDVNVTPVNIHERQNKASASGKGEGDSKTASGQKVATRKAGERASNSKPHSSQATRKSIREQKHSSELQKLLMQQLKDIQKEKSKTSMNADSSQHRGKEKLTTEAQGKLKEKTLTTQNKVKEKVKSESQEKVKERVSCEAPRKVKERVSCEAPRKVKERVSCEAPRKVKEKDVSEGEQKLKEKVTPGSSIRKSVNSEGGHLKVAGQSPGSALPQTTQRSKGSRGTRARADLKTVSSRRSNTPSLTVAQKRNAVFTTKAISIAKSRTRNANKKSLICSKCNSAFSSRKSLSFHMKVNHSDKKTFYPCPYCPSVFYYFFGVTRHLFRNHSKSTAEIDRMREKLRAKAYSKTVPPVPQIQKSLMQESKGVRKSSRGVALVHTIKPARTTANSDALSFKGDKQLPSLSRKSDRQEGKMSPKPATSSGKSEVKSGAVKPSLDSSSQKQETASESRAERLKSRTVKKVEESEPKTCPLEVSVEPGTGGTSTPVPSPTPSASANDDHQEGPSRTCPNCERSFGRKISYENHVKACKGKDSAVPHLAGAVQAKDDQSSVGKERERDVSLSRGQRQAGGQSASSSPSVETRTRKVEQISPGRSKTLESKLIANGSRATPSRGRPSSTDRWRHRRPDGSPASFLRRAQSNSADRSRNVRRRGLSGREKRDSSVESTQSNVEGRARRDRQSVLSRFASSADKNRTTSSVLVRGNRRSGGQPSDGISPRPVRDGRKLTSRGLAALAKNDEPSKHPTLLVNETSCKQEGEQHFSKAEESRSGVAARAGGVPSTSELSSLSQNPPGESCGKSHEQTASPNKQNSHVELPSVKREVVKTSSRGAPTQQSRVVKSEEDSNTLTKSTRHFNNPPLTAKQESPDKDEKTQEPKQLSVIPALADRPKRKRKVPSKNRDAEEMLSKIHNTQRGRKNMADEFSPSSGPSAKRIKLEKAVGKSCSGEKVKSEIVGDTSKTMDVSDEESVTKGESVSGSPNSREKKLKRYSDTRVNKLVDEANLTCLDCGEVFSQIFSLRRHIIGHHLKSKEVNDEGCTARDESVEDSAEEEEDVDVGKGKGRNISNRIYVVGKSNSRGKTLKCYDHVQVNKLVDEDNMRCLACGEACSQRFNLRRHIIRRHLKWCRYKCKFCPFKCFDRSECTTHIVRCHRSISRGKETKALTRFIIDLAKQGSEVRSLKKNQTLQRKQKAQSSAENIYARPNVRKVPRLSQRAVVKDANVPECSRRNQDDDDSSASPSLSPEAAPTGKSSISQGTDSRNRVVQSDVVSRNSPAVRAAVVGEKGPAVSASKSPLSSNRQMKESKAEVKAVTEWEQRKPEVKATGTAVRESRLKGGGGGASKPTSASGDSSQSPSKESTTSIPTKDLSGKPVRKNLPFNISTRNSPRMFDTRPYIDTVDNDDDLISGSQTEVGEVSLSSTHRQPKDACGKEEEEDSDMSSHLSEEESVPLADTPSSTEDAVERNIFDTMREEVSKVDGKDAQTRQSTRTVEKNQNCFEMDVESVGVPECEVAAVGVDGGYTVQVQAPQEEPSCVLALSQSKKEPVQFVASVVKVNKFADQAGSVGSTGNICEVLSVIKPPTFLNSSTVTSTAAIGSSKATVSTTGAQTGGAAQGGSSSSPKVVSPTLSVKPAAIIVPQKPATVLAGKTGSSHIPPPSASTQISAAEEEKTSSRVSNVAPGSSLRLPGTTTTTMTTTKGSKVVVFSRSAEAVEPMVTTRTSSKSLAMLSSSSGASVLKVTPSEGGVSVTLASSEPPAGAPPSNSKSAVALATATSGEGTATPKTFVIQQHYI
ncbi:uncharacterized protein LOC101853940 [Aplysia californica]|uniref:Uncharacterized protein LOC101853940 n=1 Tax=Aplysia californica TaxID=6500 RepID=A0ABM1A164_APLCA|nr:uncharacterized protein LOC101853940 [Aplysia californica]XP_012938728.1 uncharacterized protein LOC101853940 [Aplysia californica]